jgi:hypothetical protein
MLCVYAVCHLAGMSSACFNPFLYAFMNENFRKEFVNIFGKITAGFRFIFRCFAGCKCGQDKASSVLVEIPLLRKQQADEITEL